MNNWEFYRKELEKHNFAFALKNNKIYHCTEVSCPDCAFYDGGGLLCDKVKIEWLYKRYKESIVLTDDEKSLCKLLGRGWITRDKNGDLYWHENKPKDKVDEHWCIPIIPINTTIMAINKFFSQCKFEFITWEDEEPWEVKVDD